MKKMYTKETLDLIFAMLDKNKLASEIEKATNVSMSQIYKTGKMVRLWKAGDVEQFEEARKRYSYGEQLVEFIKERYSKPVVVTEVENPVPGNTEIINLFLHGLDELVKQQKQIAEALTLLATKL